ncbi:MAG: STN domain-containing protein, partial [Paramuribaculum sp.]|nr:STN domain-containing protein [Paramuribaculum sp.]
MKRSILIALIIAVVFSVSAQNVTIKATDRDAESVFAELIQQTGKNFIYPAGLLNGLKVTVNAGNTPLSEVLDKMFGHTGISYTIKGNNVTLKQADL